MSFRQQMVDHTHQISALSLVQADLIAALKIPSPHVLGGGVLLIIATGCLIGLLVQTDGDFFLHGWIGILLKRTAVLSGLQEHIRL